MSDKKRKSLPMIMLDALLVWALTFMIGIGLGMGIIFGSYLLGVITG